jgi:hypothetical protein
MNNGGGDASTSTARIVTHDEISMSRGLKITGLDEGQKCGGPSIVSTVIQEGMVWIKSQCLCIDLPDLLTTKITEAHIQPEAGFDHFLMGLHHFLKVYPSEENQSGIFKICEKTACSTWTWYFAQKFSTVKAEKVILTTSHHFLPC